MRLSEAMRLGTMMREKQAFYTLFDPHKNATCALGAAAEAIGILDTTQFNNYIPGARAPREWQRLDEVTARCPACDFSDDVQECIFHLNNHHRWTRERIADWVEVQEQRIESALSDDAVARGAEASTD